MNNPKISITVPVYNTSSYLRKCLDSLASQTLKDIEFIIVDDGSTDSSGKICDEYAKKDSRFKVIHQKNGGLSAARETGLRNASGEYIIVCDSDDWVEHEMYQKLYEKALSCDADIVICGYYTEYSDGKVSSSFISFKEHNGIVDNYDVLNRGAGWSWVKLIKRSLFTAGNIHYEQNINLSEDALIIFKLLKLNPKIVQINEPLYHYRRIFGGASYTNSLSMNHIYQLNRTYKWLQDNYTSIEYSELIKTRAIDLAFACLRVHDIDKSFFIIFMKEELPFSYFLTTPPSLKKTIVLTAKLISIDFSRLIVKKLYRFWYK